jgi:thiamine biosynthesis lipoprotein ApbE
MDISRDSVRRARPLLGTLVEISIGDPLHPNVEHAIDAAFGTVTRVHRLMSFHEDESDVGRLNRLAHRALSRLIPGRSRFWKRRLSFTIDQTRASTLP